MRRVLLLASLFPPATAMLEYSISLPHGLGLLRISTGAVLITAVLALALVLTYYTPPQNQKGTEDAHR